MKPRILITEPIYNEILEYLQPFAELDIEERGKCKDASYLKSIIGNYDAVISMLSNPVNEEVLQAGEKLKIVANYAVGYDNIDVEAATKLGIKVANTPDVLTDATADIAMALLLAVTRKICEAQHYLREDHFKGWEPLGFLGMGLNGKTMGIIGMGRIGQAVARRAKGFGVQILYHNRNKLEASVEGELNARFTEDIEALVKQSDVLSLNCPLTPETRHLIDANMLKVMPKHAVLINTARGPVVDEEALAEALINGEIGGAGLDVFEKEPAVHPKLLEAPNCVLLPHMGSATIEARMQMGHLAADAILGILNGKPEHEIPNLLN